MSFYGKRTAWLLVPGLVLGGFTTDVWSAQPQSFAQYSSADAGTVAAAPVRV